VALCASLCQSLTLVKLYDNNNRLKAAESTAAAAVEQSGASRTKLLQVEALVEKQSRELAAVTRSGSASSAVKELKAYVEDGFERVSDEATAFRDSIEQVTSLTVYLMQCSC
jgi:anti-sigma28 factor (negative regulator of flagellin synthesis)